MARTERSSVETAFGERLRKQLRERRRRSGLSARDIAKRTDLSIDTIYALERGDVLSPGIHTVYVLATALGLDLTTLARQAAAPNRRTRRTPAARPRAMNGRPTTRRSTP
jgi:transcriptional regulator with XRE-family HTH domain